MVGVLTYITGVLVSPGIIRRTPSFFASVPEPLSPNVRSLLQETNGSFKVPNVS